MGRSLHREIGWLLALACILCALLLGAAFVLPAASPDSSQQDVRFLRVMSSNPDVCLPVAGEYRDWIELVNLSDEAVELTGWRLTEGLDVRGGMVFPKTVLEAGASLVIYGGDPVEGAPSDALFCGFNLSANGASLHLIDASFQERDSLELPNMPAGDVYALNVETGEYAICSPYEDIGAGLDLNAELDAPYRADGIYISEVMASNNLTIADSHGNYSDWIELCNGSGAEVNLAGYSLTDDAMNRRKFVFPEVTLPAGGRLLVFATGEEEKGVELHAGFRLASGGERVLLIDPQGAVVSAVAYDDLESDQSLIRAENGELEKTYLPSPGHENTVQGARSSMDPGYAAPESNALGLYINEAMCVVSGRNDWVELVNESGADIDISGFGLSNNPYKPRKWQFPQGTVVPAGGYLLVQMIGADGAADGTGALCCNGFRLDGDSDEPLLLSDAQGNVLDRMLLASQRRDVSYGRLNGAYRYFTSATPGAANGGTSYGYCPRPVRFSQLGGVQSGPVELELSSDEGMTIYYTTDGSDPTSSSPVYTAPLTISENTVVKAIAWREDAIPSYAAANTYIFGAEHTVGVVAVSGKPSELTGSSGTLKTGKVGDGYSVFAEFYDLDGSQIIAQGCQLKLNGSSSRLENDQKAFRLVAKNIYSNNRFCAELFSRRDYEEYKSVVLRAGGQDHSYAFMRDVVLTSLAHDTSVMYQESETVVVYVNGKYWGVYHLRERICPESICQFEGWENPDAVDLLEGKDGIAVQGSSDNFREMMRFVKNEGVKSDENLAKLRTYMDVENYLEYVMLQIYSNNRDLNNVRMYRSTEEDGLWRWILFDEDLGFRSTGNSVRSWMTSDGEVGSVTPQSNVLFVALMKNDEMRDWFMTRFGELLATNMSSQSVLAKIELEYSLLEPEMEMECARWDMSQEKWKSRCADFAKEASTRTATIIAQLIDRFELSDEEAQRYFGTAMAQEGM